jgi:hypothetical protein
VNTVMNLRVPQNFRNFLSSFISGGFSRRAELQWSSIVCPSTRIHSCHNYRRPRCGHHGNICPGHEASSTPSLGLSSVSSLCTHLCSFSSSNTWKFLGAKSVLLRNYEFLSQSIHYCKIRSTQVTVNKQSNDFLTNFSDTFLRVPKLTALTRKLLSSFA